MLVGVRAWKIQENLYLYIFVNLCIYLGSFGLLNIHTHAPSPVLAKVYMLMSLCELSADRFFFMTALRLSLAQLAWNPWSCGYIIIIAVSNINQGCSNSMVPSQQQMKKTWKSNVESILIIFYSRGTQGISVYLESYNLVMEWLLFGGWYDLSTWDSHHLDNMGNVDILIKWLWESYSLVWYFHSMDNQCSW